MEAKHWFGAVGMGAALIAVSFAFNQYQKPGDTPGARALVADLGDTGGPPVASIDTPSPVVTVPVPVLGVKGSGGGKQKTSGGAAAGQPKTVKAEPVKTDLANALVGRVKWDGKVPKNPAIDMNSDQVCAALHSETMRAERIVVDGDANVANVVVYVKGVPPGSGTAKTDDVLLNQQGCTYDPHVLAFQLTQSVKVTNSDATTHNVHFKSKLNGDWNMTQSSKGTIPSKEGFAKAEVGTSLFKCDIHPWMEARAAIFEHPFFATSKATGTFEIDTTGLPDGKYEIWAWHEKYKTAKVKGVEVKQGQVVQLQFTFNRKKKNKGAVVAGK